MPKKRTKVLFVDDDEQLLSAIRQLMGAYAGDAWEIYTAQDTARGLALMREQKIDLLVLDVHMPVVDGLQFLKLLHRKFPNLLKVVLTGDATGAYRAGCLSNGAELFLEKPRAQDGWQSVFATLHELTKFQPEEEGFRGVLRRVGLQDVLQMECLARNSSLLEVSTTGESVGKIYILDGQIIHTQVGDQTGEEAFYQLLSLAGGEFNLKPFAEPPQRTISDSWEFLLMESARKRDEFGQEEATRASVEASKAGVAPGFTVDGLESELAAAPEVETLVAPEADHVPAVAEPSLRPQIEEMLICSAHGDVLYEWQSHNTNARISFLEFLSQKSRQLGQGLPLGQFDRLEVEGGNARILTQVQVDRAIFIRSSRVSAQVVSEDKA
jgi:CheY-like chemotaxis protein